MILETQRTGKENKENDGEQNIALIDWLWELENSRGEGMKYKCILGDCLEEMRKMHSNSVDVVFTSPPYNDSGRTDRDMDTRRHIKYEYIESRDDWYEWQCECIDEMLRVAKRQVMYNIQPILSNKADVWRLIGHYADVIDQILIWYKPNAQPQPHPHRIGAAYEMVLILRGDEFDKLWCNSTRYRNVIVKNINTNHEWSDKHRALMSEPFADELIKEFTQDGDVVLDPFMGLATTGLSCRKFNRDFIGIEIYKPYYEIANERLKRAVAQVSLFDPVEEYKGEQIVWP